MIKQQSMVLLLMPGDSLLDNVVEYRICRGDFMVRFAETDIDNPMIIACKSFLPRSATLKLLPYPPEEDRIGNVAVFSVSGDDVGSIKPIEVTVPLE